MMSTHFTEGNMYKYLLSPTKDAFHVNNSEF
jgi:hypothetical protein